MERQKIFWVVLSVSVFVVVVLVVGAFLLRPQPAGTSASAPGTVSPLSDPGTQVYEYQRETPLTSSGATGAAGQASGNTETQHFYIGEGPGTSGTSGTTQPIAPSSALPPTAAPATAPSSTASTTPAAKGVTTEPAAAPAPRTMAALPLKTAPAKTPTTARQSIRVIEYWIQTGSYKSQTKAEELAALLDGKGLSGRVFSYAAQGSTWYRVRVGPYTSKGEADKFLSEVKKLQGLEASYVAQVGPVSRPVN